MPISAPNPDPRPRTRPTGLRGLIALALFCGLEGCGGGDRSQSTDRPGRSVGASASASEIRFDIVGAESGLAFDHVSGKSGAKLMPEWVGSGVAPIDVDMDGLLDPYFVSQTFLLEPADPRVINRVFRNLGDWRFRDVTDPSGLGDAGFGQGVGVGDIDNDGFRDLHVCNYGRNVLFRNHGDGTYGRRTGAPSAPGWSTGCAFFDGDGDGDVDLYVGCYSSLRVEDHPPCNRRPGQAPTYCLPQAVEPGADAYFENAGDGTFVDATEAAGLARPDGRAFQVMAAQLNDDDFIDLYVANDASANFLYLGRGDGTFTDASESSGAAFNLVGQADGSMGLAIEDLDGDGCPELFVTNYFRQYNTLYRNLGAGRFLDVTQAEGLAGQTRHLTGWGAGLIDFDNDGWPDLFVSNGHIDDMMPGESGVPYRQAARLWRNGQGARFEDVGSSAGEYFRQDHVGRGCAFGDFDRDGDLDVMLNNLDEPALALRNQTLGAGRSIVVRAIGRLSNRDGVGTRIAVTANGRTIHRQVYAGASYLSAATDEVVIGLGSERADAVRVTWPSGRSTRRSLSAAGSEARVLNLVEPIE